MKIYKLKIVFSFMIIEYNEDISKQEFIVSAEELKELKIEIPFEQDYFLLWGIDNPVVALDAKKLCSLTNGELIKHLFVGSKNPQGTLYGGVNTYWLKLSGTWPATIDSLVHLRGQRKSKSFAEAKKILDIGCGTGIAGNYASQKNKNIQSVDFADVNPNNVKTAIVNSPNSKGIISNGFENVHGKYDVILASAVPAMPVYSGLKREINPLFEGTAFLEGILRDSSEHLNEKGKLIISHSSMAENIFQDLVKKYGAKVEELDHREIAFREDFLQDENWISYLIELGGLRFEEKDGHKYWFDARVRELSFE